MSEELTPDQTDAVRRALRAARHDAPVPDEVAARLDDRLAALVADRQGLPAASSTVVPLDRSRRYRRRTTLLVAAAATVVAGVGATQLLGSSGEDALSTADRGAAAESSSDAAGDLLAPVPSVGNDLKSLTGEDGLASTSSSLLSTLSPTALVQLTSAGYSDLRPIDLGADHRFNEQYDSAERSTAAASSCRPFTRSGGPWKDLAARPTTTYIARHDGREVLLEVAPGPQVTAYPCGGGEPTPVPLD